MTIAVGLADYRESAQQFEVQSVKPLAAAARADSPVHGIDALIPALPLQGREGAAVRIQRWYRHRQAERRVRFSPAVHMTTAKSCVVHTAVALIVLYVVLQHKSIWHLPLMAVIVLWCKGLRCRGLSLATTFHACRQRSKMSGSLCSSADMLLEYTMQKPTKGQPAMHRERLWQKQLLPKLQGLQMRSKYVPIVASCPLLGFIVCTCLAVKARMQRIVCILITQFAVLDGTH